jgi:hypothetical protein
MAHADGEVRFTRALPARHLPSSGFGYPLDGLRPRDPCRPCFMPAAPMGFSLRSFLLARGWPAFLPAAPRVPLPQTSLGRTEIRRSSGLKPGFRVLPRANPSHSHQVFSPKRCRMLPWFLIPLKDRHRLAPASRLRSASSHALGHPHGYPYGLFRRLRVSQAVRLIRLVKAECPSQGFAP